jgi:hypothetical protein
MEQCVCLERLETPAFQIIYRLAEQYFKNSDKFINGKSFSVTSGFLDPVDFADIVKKSTTTT